MNVQNIIAGEFVEVEGKTFQAIDPSTEEKLPEIFTVANKILVNEALAAANSASIAFKNIGSTQKAAFLRAIATEISTLGDALVDRAVAESGLPKPRLLGEMGRTTSQLRLFADLVEEGSWIDATIDTALPERTPLPRPDLRRMLVALGPVVVFGASNFPLAFSVAGGDTASAFAAGCPVIVKVHPAHPGTSALVGKAICKATKETGMPKGIFSMLYDDGFTVGEALVKHPQTKAVTFTGSFKGGMALLKMAQERPSPIPVFTEMGSINPVLFLPGILSAQPEQLAAKYAASITLGAGQFCTNPGLMLAIQSPGLDQFTAELARKIEAVPSATMLTPGIWKNYEHSSQAVLTEENVELIAKSNLVNEACVNQSKATFIKVNGAAFLANHKLREEIFGPLSMLVVAEDLQQLEQIAASLDGQLTVTVMAEKAELANYTNLINTLQNICGRLILNNPPTGVEVCAAMQHGGPFPASSDSRFTSVGTAAIYRFVRPVAWQDWEDSLLPPELQSANPLKIWRNIDNQWTKD
ncbi:MAG: aldehyde dehydrogenase (NADP(+)) [Janthinobacterium lividum]